MALKAIPGIGNILFKQLIDHFQTPDNVFRAALSDLIQVEGISENLARKIATYIIPDTIKKDLDYAFSKGFKVITMHDPLYPALLLEIADPPPILYVAGTLDPALHNIAIVGSRNATQYGRSIAHQLSMDLAGKGFSIVSGMAIGIDTSAHTGALDANGNTVAVLGSGLERIYPATNRRLFHRISQQGAVISEFPLSAKPVPHHFPMRNRIISGMALGTIVVEATKKSGSLITARLAGEQGREVFAVPGSVHSFKSTGTHNLLKQGARLVENANDVIEELSLFTHPVNEITEKKVPKEKKIPVELDPDELTVYEALEPYPVHIDAIVHETGVDPGKLAGILLQLELKGLIYQSPGKRFATNEE